MKSSLDFPISLITDERLQEILSAPLALAGKICPSPRLAMKFYPLYAFDPWLK
jgi:hypothetical protein